MEGNAVRVGLERARQAAGGRVGVVVQRRAPSTRTRTGEPGATATVVRNGSSGSRRQREHGHASSPLDHTSRVSDTETKAFTPTVARPSSTDTYRAPRSEASESPPVPSRGNHVSRPARRRPRVEAGLRDGVHVRTGRVLHEQAPGLELHVLAVGVGEQVLPDAALPGQRPEPELLPRHLLVAGPVAEAPVVVVVVAPEEVVELAHDVVRLVAVEGVVAVEREVAAAVVHGPVARASRVLQVGVARESSSPGRCGRRPRRSSSCSRAAPAAWGWTRRRSSRRPPGPPAAGPPRATACARAGPCRPPSSSRSRRGSPPAGSPPAWRWTGVWPMTPKLNSMPPEVHGPRSAMLRNFSTSFR